MKLYYVSIDFKSGPAYSTEVEAYTEAQAKRDALSLARDFGFDGIVKRVAAVIRETA